MLLYPCHLPASWNPKLLLLVVLFCPLSSLLQISPVYVLTHSNHSNLHGTKEACVHGSKLSFFDWEPNLSWRYSTALFCPHMVSPLSFSCPTPHPQMFFSTATCIIYYCTQVSKGILKICLKHLRKGYNFVKLRTKIFLNSYGALTGNFVLFPHRKSSEKALRKTGSLMSGNTPSAFGNAGCFQSAGE